MPVFLNAVSMFHARQHDDVAEVLNSALPFSVLRLATNKAEGMNWRR